MPQCLLLLQHLRLTGLMNLSTASSAGLRLIHPVLPQLPRSLLFKRQLKSPSMLGPFLLLLLLQERLKHLQHLLLLQFLRKILSAGWLCSLHRPRHLLQRLPPRSFQRLYLPFLQSSLKLKKWMKMWILVTWAPSGG